MQPQQKQDKSRSFLQKLLQSPPSLPFEPSLLPMLFAMTREDSKASTADLVALIEHSQKLTARVLAIANSAAYGLEFKVSSLYQAVRILGVHEVRMLAILVGTASVIEGAKLPRNFEVSTLWRHQLKVAAVARRLAEDLGGPNGVCGPAAPEGDRLTMLPDEAYVAGLLHDIGKVFFAASRPDLWEDVEKIWKESGLRYFEAEESYWGMDHAYIGAAVLHAWKLPLLLTESVNWHHAPELAPAYGMEARLVAAANHFVHGEYDAERYPWEHVVSLLPAGFDADALKASLAQSLSAAKTEALAVFVQ